jgi:hypothetical protein
MRFRFKKMLFLLGALWSGGGVNALTLDPPEVVFGTVLPFESVRQEILLINDSAETIEIADLRSIPPDRLTLHADQDQIEPGKIGVLSVAFQANHEEGPIDFLVVVETAQRQDPYVLSVCADVRGDYRIVGHPLFFENLREAGGRHPRVLSVAPSLPATPPLQMGRVDDPFFSIVVQEPRPPRGVQSVVLSPLDSLPEGWTRHVVALPVSDHARSPFRVEVSAFYPPSVHVYPSEILLTPSRREQMRTLFVDNYLDEPLAIERVETPGTRVRWELAPDGFLDRLRINLYFMDGWASGDERAVVVHFADPAVQPARITVRMVQQNDISIPYPETVAFIASRSRCGCVR